MGLLLSSCNDWFEVTPPSQIREGKQFSTVEGFQQALIGCYIGMTDDLLYGRALTWGTLELMAGQYHPLEQYSSNDYYIANYNYTSTKGVTYINGIWEKSYNVISNANNILKYIEVNKNVLDNINYKLIKGEALAIRAFMHFDLLRLYGYGNLAQRREFLERATIPYVTTLDKNITPQSTHKEVINKIIKDLEEAISLLEIDPVTKNNDNSFYMGVNIDGFFSNRQQRFNYYASTLLLARVYLWEGSSESISKALTLSLKVKDEAVAKGLVKWVNATTVNSDMIMKQEHLTSLNTLNLFSKTANYFLMDIRSAGDVNAQFVSGGVMEQVYETTTVGATDFRFTNQFIQNSKIVDGRNAYTPLKYYGSSSSTTTVSNNYIPLIRLPEAFYIAAECHLKKSTPDPTAALALLNQVRAQRGITQPLSGLNAQALMNEIVKEYRKEYYTEGQMFLLYKRIGAETIPNYLGSADDKIYLLPYPQNEIHMGRVQ